MNFASRALPMNASQPAAPQSRGRTWAEGIDDKIPPLERKVVNVVSLVMIATVLTMKFAVPGTNNIEAPFFYVMGLMVWMLVKGYGRISLRGLFIYLLLCTLMMAWQIISPLHPELKPKAAFFFITMYLPFLVRMQVSKQAYLLLLKRFQYVCMFIGAMVFVDWATQLAGLPMPDMEQYVPKSFMFVNYNYIQPIHWGSPFMKPNAFFMLETSHTSQLLAMGLLIEVCIFRRAFYLLFLGAALLSTYGGTGLLLVLLGAPVALFYMTRRTIVLGLLAAPLLFLLAVQIGLADNVAGRTREFDTQNTSGYSRFIEPFVVLKEITSQGTFAAMFGTGAGNLPSVSGHEVYVVNPVTKVMAEYGIPLGFFWIIWFHAIAFGRGAPVIVAVAPLLQYNFMNGSLLVPINTYYILFLCTLIVPPKKSGKRASVARSPLTFGRRAPAPTAAPAPAPAPA